MIEEQSRLLIFLQLCIRRQGELPCGSRIRTAMPSPARMVALDNVFGSLRCDSAPYGGSFGVSQLELPRDAVDFTVAGGSILDC